MFVKMRKFININNTPHIYHPMTGLLYSTAIYRWVPFWPLVWWALYTMCIGAYRSCVSKTWGAHGWCTAPGALGVWLQEPLLPLGLTHQSFGARSEGCYQSIYASLADIELKYIKIYF